METAPETWEGGHYDERSDLFSFGVILWRLFGTNAQNQPPNPLGGGPVLVSAVDDIDEIEIEYLRQNGRDVPPPQQREAIRKVA